MKTERNLYSTVRNLKLKKFLFGKTVNFKVAISDRIPSKNTGNKLKVVALMSAGYDHVDVRELTKRKIKIGNIRSVLSDCVAEVAIGLALAVSHRFKEGYLRCSKGKWVTGEPDWLLGKQLSGSVVGIVGFGDIGSAIANKLVPFNVKKIFYSGHGRKRAAENSAAEFVDFSELLSESDFVFLSCPLTDETKHMFNYSVFSNMKPTSVIINVGRGGVIKTDDLVKALREHLLWGAGLDVTDPEPLPADHPLLHMDNCFVSPHIGSATLATREAMALLTADNIIAALEGKRLPSEVCFKADLCPTKAIGTTKDLMRIPAKHIIISKSPIKHN